jgi:hypothetical protein
MEIDEEKSPVREGLASNAAKQIAVPLLLPGRMDVVEQDPIIPTLKKLGFVQV